MPERAVSRRRFLQITAIGAGGLAALTLPHLLAQSPAAVSESRFLLGTVINLTVVASSQTSGREAIRNTFMEIERLSSILSRFDPGSELARLNCDGKLAQASPELIAVLQQALNWGSLTNGAFDVTVKPLVDLYQARQSSDESLPSQRALETALRLVDYRQVRIMGSDIQLQRPGMGVTLDGIAKGYVVDAAVRVLQTAGFTNVLVAAAGDLYAGGRRADATAWQIGVRAPNQPGGLVARFTLTNGAASTSGDYEQPFTPDCRLHHILDPRTGESPTELSSVTVTAATACEADALATSIMVLGSTAGLALLARLPGMEAYLITKSGQVIGGNSFGRAQ